MNNLVLFQEYWKFKLFIANIAVLLATLHCGTWIARRNWQGGVLILIRVTLGVVWFAKKMGP